MKNIELAAAIVCVGFSAALFADNSSPRVTDDGTLWLHVPLAEYDGVPGYFQNGHFMLQHNGLWKLVSFEAGDQIPWLTGARVVKTATVPVQVFLEIDGQLADGCKVVGDAAVTLQEDEFVVAIYQRLDPALADGTYDCTTALVPFTKLVPLPVYGLAAGEYNYRVNEVLSGSFILSVDNTLP